MENRWDKEADVVIAGGGGAGMAAAIELRDAGADVLVFDKQQGIWEASSYLSGGAMAFAGTDLQEKEGIQDSEEILYNDLVESGGHKAIPEVLKAYVSIQMETYRWLKAMGVKFTAIQAFGGMSQPRGHVTDASEQLKILEANARKKGARIFFETKVTGLITDKDKRVIGVTVEGKAGKMRVKARKGVILATGGIGRDLERLLTIDPLYDQVMPVMGVGHQGDGHRMVEALGGFLRDIEYIKPTFGQHINGKRNEDLTLMFYNGAIIVNKEAKRFINESLSYKEIGKQSLRQPGGMGYQIFDQKMFDEALAKGSKPWGLDERRVKLVVKADTIAELAVKLGLSPKALKDTVDTYNRYVEAGKDPDFGRKAIAGDVGTPVKVEVAPFYGYPSKSLFPATYGGIAVDGEMHVITHKGKIPGLYAAGEIVGGFHGASYMSGSSLGKAIIFGRIAARNAAAGK